MSRMLKALQQLDAKRRDEPAVEGAPAMQPGLQVASPPAPIAAPAASAAADNNVAVEFDMLAPVVQYSSPVVDELPSAPIEQQPVEPVESGNSSLFTWVADSMPGLAIQQQVEAPEPSTAVVERDEQPPRRREQPAEEEVPDGLGILAADAPAQTTIADFERAVDDRGSASQQPHAADSAAQEKLAPQAAALDLSNTSDSAAATPASDVPKTADPATAGDSPGGEALLKNHFVGPPPEPPPPATDFERRIEQRLSDSQLGASYRRLAENIAADYNGTVPATLMFAAPQSSSDVGETIAHIAPLLAENNEQTRILLVDADLASKSLSRSCEQAGQAGLVEVLSRHKNWHDYVVRTSQERIDLLPAGQGEVTSYKAVGDRLAAVLREFCEQYTYVLFDAGESQQPLTAKLAPATDAAYLHVHLGETESETASGAVKHLHSAGARLRGCIVHS